jgi:Cu2+-exporting ATPase
MGQSLTAGHWSREPRAAPRSEPAPDRNAAVDLAVENMRCGGCMSAIEQALGSLPGVVSARVNLSAKRVTAEFDPDRVTTEELITRLDHAGYRAAEIIDARGDHDAGRARDLLRRVGVAGFAAANIMLLSVSVWAGLASDMDRSAASLFHWLSALIALPTIAYAAQPFYRSAASALKARRLNMDVPISLGITLATAMSLYQTWRGTDQVYFDAAVMLTFFLLIGRYLDEEVRVRARGAAENLLGLKALTAIVIGEDGAVRAVPARLLTPGMRVLVPAGERIPVDGTVVAGESEIEESLITGETLPKLKAPGASVYAGTVNTTGPLTIEATAADDQTLVAEIARLMRAAEQGRGRYVRLADRAARLYAPAVHLLGLTTFLGWSLAGAGWEQALTTAIAVLIITCPCALALAVPVVQVAATTRLFARGIIVKAADGLERLAEADTIVFDKTGTLTLGEPRLIRSDRIDKDALKRAAAIAATSRHPYSRALVRAIRESGFTVVPAPGVREIPGSGLVAETAEGEERLGSGSFAGEATRTRCPGTADVWYARPGHTPVGFQFEDQLRPGAREVVSRLGEVGYDVELLSGDRSSIVSTVADAAGIKDWRGEVRPDGKIARLDALKARGRRVLMIGDGLNDAPALAAGHASLSPSTAADISQTTADAIFQGERLEPVLETLAVARAARAMALQNFAIALLYNLISVPLAMAGQVTPLIAALAMSGSSIAVTANALRLRTKPLRLEPLRGKR